MIDNIETTETLDALLSRRSVRKYTEDKIEPEKIQVILEAGMAAPTCVNSREWTFIVVDNRETLNKMAEANGRAATLLTWAPCAILVCGDYDKAFKGGKDYWIIDCAAACENMIVAAQGMGIGSCWLGTYPQMERVNNLKKLFNLPDNIIPHSIIAFGYPIDDITDERPSRYDESLVHYNKW